MRKQSSGRRRLPPAASASPATSCASPGRAATARARPASTSAMYAARPGVAWTCASALTRSRPGMQRDDRPAEQRGTVRRRSRARASAPPAPRRPGTASPTPAGTCRRSPRAAPCPSSGTIRSNQSEKNGRRIPRGCVISRIASRPPGRSTRRSSASASSRSATLRTPKPTVAASNVAVVERKREQVALHPVDLRALAARALEHPLGEVEPGHCARARLQLRQSRGRRCRTRRRARRRRVGRPPPRPAAASARRAPPS